VPQCVPDFGHFQLHCEYNARIFRGTHITWRDCSIHGIADAYASLNDRPCNTATSQIGFVIIYDRGYRVNVPVSGFARMSATKPSNAVFNATFNPDGEARYCVPLEYANNTDFPNPSVWQNLTYETPLPTGPWNRMSRRWPQISAPK